MTLRNHRPARARAVGQQYGRRCDREPAQLVAGDPRQGTCPRQIPAGRPGWTGPGGAGAGHGGGHGRARRPPARRWRPCVVVTDDAAAASTLGELGAVIVPDEPAAGLNPALAHGASRGRRAAGPGRARPALAADLPALRPAELDRGLRAAARWPEAFVADAAGTGTTLYAARPGTPFRPRFGAGSAGRYRAGGAVEILLADVPSLRSDVDTAGRPAARHQPGARPAHRPAGRPSRLSPGAGQRVTRFVRRPTRTPEQHEVHEDYHHPDDQQPEQALDHRPHDAQGDGHDDEQQEQRHATLQSRVSAGRAGARRSRRAGRPVRSARRRPPPGWPAAPRRCRSTARLRTRFFGRVTFRYPGPTVAPSRGTKTKRRRVGRPTVTVANAGWSVAVST